MRNSISKNSSNRPSSDPYPALITLPAHPQYSRQCNRLSPILWIFLFSCRSHTQFKDKFRSTRTAKPPNTRIRCIAGTRTRESLSIARSETSRNSDILLADAISILSRSVLYAGPIITGPKYSMCAQKISAKKNMTPLATDIFLYMSINLFSPYSPAPQRLND